MGEPVSDIGTNRLAQHFILLLNFKKDSTNFKIFPTMTTYKCPSSDHRGDLEKYVCINCRKHRFIKIKDGSYPFACGNCDITCQFLICPN